MPSSKADSANELFPEVVLEVKSRLVACGAFPFKASDSSRGSKAKLLADFLVVADESLTRLLSGSKEELPTAELPAAELPAEELTAVEVPAANCL